MNPDAILISHLSHEGRGLAKVDGKTLFVEGALPGETVTIKGLRRRAKFDEAQVETVLEVSPERVTPPCPHFLQCGGCSLQHWHPQAQLKYKEQVVLELLQHTAKLAPQRLMPALTAATEGYRRKARLGVKYLAKKDTVLVGFREKAGSFITSMHACHVLDPRVGFKIQALRDFIGTLAGRSVIPQLEVACGDAAVVLIVRHMEALCAEDQQQWAAFGSAHGFHIYLQPKGLDSIHPLTPEQAIELYYELPAQGLRIAFQPEQFVQVNAPINQKMVNQACEWLQLSACDRVLDLFCGVGNFSLALAQHAGFVVGVEGDGSAIVQARKNAQSHSIQNAEFHVANLMEAVAPFSWARAHYDAILLDPPRTGALELIPSILSWRPSRLVYISCNPATFVRDAALLAEGGYCLQRLGVMDMFPHTQHIETMALFVRS